MSKLGKTQEKVLNYLRNDVGGAQLSAANIRAALNLTPDACKNAIMRLVAAGHVLKTTSHPALYQSAPQVVSNPPAAHTAPLHGTMPQA